MWRLPSILQRMQRALTRVSWRAVLVQGVLIVALFAAVRVYQQRGLAAGEAPSLQGRLLDGRPVALQQFRGRPLVVHFWASWCRVCRLEHAGIAALAVDHPVVTVAMRSGDERAIAAFLAEQGAGFPIMADPDGAVAAAWGVRAVPTTFVLDGEGRIRFTEVGYTSATGLRARLWLAAWVGRAARPAVARHRPAGLPPS